jgi:hypothetical protein
MKKVIIGFQFPVIFKRLISKAKDILNGGPRAVCVRETKDEFGFLSTASTFDVRFSSGEVLAFEVGEHRSDYDEESGCFDHYASILVRDDEGEVVYGRLFGRSAENVFCDRHTSVMETWLTLEELGIHVENLWSLIEDFDESRSVEFWTYHDCAMGRIDHWDVIHILEIDY